MALSFRDQVSFILKDNFSIKSLKFLELIQDQARDIYTEDDAARFDAEFTIMTETIKDLLNSLTKAFSKETHDKAA